MNRLIAYMGSDPERLRAVLLDHRELLLTAVPTEGHASNEAVVSWGVGFYQGGEVLLQRRPRVSGQTIDLMEPLNELRTDTFLAQSLVRRGSRMAKSENTPPYRFRSWIMTHHGDLPEMEQSHDVLLKMLPDFLRRNIRGQTDSELLFHLFLACLHEAGRANLEDANLPPELAHKALRHALGRLREVVKGSAEAPLQIGLTNGRSLVLLRQGAWPLWMKHLVAPSGSERNNHPFRGVMMVGQKDALRGAEGFEEIPAGHAILVGRDLAPRVEAA